MDSGTSFGSVIAVSDLQGNLVRVIRDDLGWGDRIASGRTFLGVVDAADLQKARTFIKTFQENEAVFDWPLAVPSSGCITVVHFAGYRAGDELTLIGALSRNSLVHTVTEILQNSGESGEALRRAVAAELSATDERDELANALREILEQNAEMTHAVEMERQMLRVVAHDLRNPLNSILLNSYALATGVAQPSDQQRKFVTDIQRAASLMNRLVDDLLDAASLAQGDPRLSLEEADLVEIIRQNLASNQAQAGQKGIELMLECGEQIPKPMIDRNRIDQVLNNLIGNAIKFSPASSTITVHVNRAQGAAVVRVKDQGPGIPADERETIFEPFKKGIAGHSEKGSGLGLAIARALVESHGGKLWMETEVQKGSTFCFTLPLPSAQKEDVSRQKCA